MIRIFEGVLLQKSCCTPLYARIFLQTAGNENRGLSILVILRNIIIFLKNIVCSL